VALFCSPSHLTEGKLQLTLLEDVGVGLQLGLEALARACFSHMLVFDGAVGHEKKF